MLSEIALEAVRVAGGHKRVIECLWAALALLYSDLVDDGSIERIEKLPKETKERYWKEVNDLIPHKTRFRKIMAARAIYVYDLITKE